MHLMHPVEPEIKTMILRKAVYNEKIRAAFA